MIIEFCKTPLQDMKPLIDQYVESLTCVVDDFWEDHIINAESFSISLDGDIIGCFTIWNNEKITLFTMKEKFLYLAQTVFKRILSEFYIKSAFVATCDELFLSLCLDFHATVEMQAYFFDGTTAHNVKPPEFCRECLQKVPSSELQSVKGDTGDFFDSLSAEQLESGESMLFRLALDGKALGFGIIVPNKLLKGYWACGMITLAEHRLKGVGRSLQIHMADICRENGVKPISGCWYGNHLSKKTIESAGRYSKTRLLNVLF